MKGYYLFAPVEAGNAGPGSGVERKVRAQCGALNEYVPCELVTLPPAEYSGSTKEKIVRRLPFTAAWRKWHYKGEFNDADFVYIRMVYHDASFVRYLKKLRKNNPGVKIIYEIPTYPYDQQRTISLASFPFVVKERINRMIVAKLVDVIVTFYGQREIWGVPCIPLMNGFDFSSVSLQNRTVGDEIPMVSVAATAFWHGYQYLIQGLRDYYANGGEENVVFHMVGNKLPEHDRMVREYGLEDHVVFHGLQSAEGLAKIYSSCLIGINVLGVCSDGNPKSSSLKSREYAAYGLPMVSALPVDYLPENYEYLLLVPPIDEPVDIQKVTEFYHQVYDGKNCNEIAERIRSFAQPRCDMIYTMKPVVQWITEHTVKGSEMNET